MRLLNLIINCILQVNSVRDYMKLLSAVYVDYASSGYIIGSVTCQKAIPTSVNQV